ncbi:fumarylacetoacetase [Aquicoccus sp. SCR17]|nr:fumarylacetoacetase [Carideicomes alvinocaridis]
MPLKKSWVESANSADTPFPLNNLPYGVFATDDLDPRCGVAIGDMILDCQRAEEEGLIALGDAPLFDVPFWNEVMEEGPEAWAALRDRLTQILEEGSKDREAAEKLLVKQSDATMQMPFLVAEYTDFYAGRNHAFNVGSLFRGPENALPPNWLHIPIGYNGRASSVVVSGTEVRRPWGQLKGPNDDKPRFAPCERFDLELEMGAIVGTASDGPVTVDEADQMIFGYVLLNDWSARDIQAWEYQPLGPFQAKATATTISPWIVTRAALEPFRTDTPEREVELLPHLKDTGPMLYDIELSVSLAPEGGQPTTISQTNYSVMYYSSAQQLAHHTTAGSPMTPGDLLGSGTISGTEKGTLGSLLELSWGGKNPVQIDGGERTFLQDGDTLTLHGHAQGDGYRIGFGDCTGTLLPALSDPYARG